MSRSDPALFGLLLWLADNKHALGRRYSEWCTGAPVLESAVAAAAMAQDELGHARSFYPLLRGFGSGDGPAVPSMEERGWHTRTGSALACLRRPFASWSQFIAANLLVDTAVTVLLEGAQDSGYEPLRQRARKIVQEEAAHWVHAVGWVDRLAHEKDRRADLQTALLATAADAFSPFGQDGPPTVGVLVDAGLLAETADALRGRLEARVAEALAPSGLTAAPDPAYRSDAAPSTSSG